jgi:hypothetical protein
MCTGCRSALSEAVALREIRAKGKEIGRWAGVCPSVSELSTLYPLGRAGNSLERVFGRVLGTGAKTVLNRAGFGDLAVLRERFQQARPFRHLCIDNFLLPALAAGAG